MKNEQIVDELKGLTAVDVDLLNKTAIMAAEQKRLRSIRDREEWVFWSITDCIKEAAASHERSAYVMMMRNEDGAPKEYEVRVLRIIAVLSLPIIPLIILGIQMRYGMLHTVVGLAGFISVLALGPICIGTFGGIFDRIIIKPIGLSERVLKYCKERGFKVRIASNRRIKISW